MNYLGKFIDNFRYAYKEINAATLTGAIDVIVVEQPDGTFKCSPFHVRFGKIGVLRSREKIVEIEINGEPCEIYMKLGESGEAFFVEELSDEEEQSLPEHLVCSPIPSYSEPQEKTSDPVVWTTVANGEARSPDDETVPPPPVEFPSPRTFHAKTVPADGVVLPAEFRPIREAYALDESTKNGAKKKRRRKRKAPPNERREPDDENVENEEEAIRSPDATRNDNESGDEQNANTEISIIDSSSAVTVSVTKSNDLHFFSDTDVSCNSHDTKSFSPVQSDSELEVSSRLKGEGQNDDNQGSVLALQPSWRWGELPSPIPKPDLQEPSKEPVREREQEVQRSMLASMLGFMKKTKRIRQTNELDGSIYLSQLDPDELDPEIARLYLPHYRCMDDTFKAEDDQKVSVEEKDEDVESGNGPSLAHSPVSELESPRGPISNDTPDINDKNDDCSVEMSLCGNSLQKSDNKITDEQFDEHLISYEQFVNDTAIFKNPNLMFRINGSIYKWDAACPIILSYALFKKPLPKETLERLESEKKIGNLANDEKRHRKGPGYYSWFYWARNSRNKQSNENSTDDNKAADMPLNDSMGKVSITSSNDTYNEATTPPNDTEFLSTQESVNDLKRIRTYSSTDSELDTPDSPPKERYRKTLRLTSEQIMSLKLQPGPNEVMFSVTTAYQGTTRCKCSLFLWRYDDKIIISDIDGTITKSDVLGHIMPIVGNAWAQSGVAKLFNRIEDNGYKLLYLSARAIGQSKGTRNYLYSIKQEDLTLPEGPLLLNPTSLLSAFHREVIEKKPEEFKISCLRDIQALFPSDPNPFYAGYGNKINDVWTYQAVGIPMFRIFTINHRGELRHELNTTFRSSYLSMSQIADQLFPVRTKQSPAEEYSDFTYWREPIAQIDEIELPPSVK